jgi:hypothetical protein
MPRETTPCPRCAYNLKVSRIYVRKYQKFESTNSFFCSGCVIIFQDYPSFTPESLVKWIGLDILDSSSHYWVDEKDTIPISEKLLNMAVKSNFDRIKKQIENEEVSS